MVTAGSAAEMPWRIPRRASIDTVNAVPRGARFSATIMVRPSAAMRSSVSAKQIRPRPYFAMKLMASGVTFSAAPGLRRANRRDVRIGAVLHQKLHGVDVHGVRRAPERGRPVEVFEAAV